MATHVTIHHYWPVVLGDPPVCNAACKYVELQFAQYLLLWGATTGKRPTLHDTFFLTTDVANSAFLTLQTPLLPPSYWNCIVQPTDEVGERHAKMRAWAREHLSPEIEI